MNDELNAQVTAPNWSIPRYLLPHLSIMTESDTVPLEGSSGLFTLTVPARELTLTAGKGHMPLVRFHWEPDTLGWDGAVRIGGSVESITMKAVNGLPVAMVTVMGLPLHPHAAAYLPAGREIASTAPTPHADGLIDGDDHFYTWLVPEDSALMPLVESAMLNGAPVWLSGNLGDEAGQWHLETPLPLILEAVTVFAPLR